MEILLSSDFPSAPCDLYTFASGVEGSPFLLAMSLLSFEMMTIHRERCRTVLGRMARSPISTMPSLSEIEQVLDKLVLFDDDDIVLALAHAATEEEEFVKYFLTRLIGRNRFDQLEEWLLGNRGRRTKEVWELTFNFLRTHIKSGVYDIAYVLRSATTNDIKNGNGVFVIEKAFDLGFDDIAEKSVPLVVPSAMINTLNNKTTLLKSLIRLEEPYILWPIFKAFVDESYGRLAL